MNTDARPRRTNAERTATTRAKLLDAAAACLSDRGYAHTTTTVVAERAGVSRGALLHNFPTRTELVVAAAQHLFDQRVEEIRAMATSLAEGPDRADAVIEMLFEIAGSPTGDAILEVINAGRTDPELRPLVASLSERFHRTVTDLFTEIFPRPPESALGPYYDAVPTLFLAIADGLTVQRVAGDPGVRHHAAVLDMTKYLGRTLLGIQATDLEEKPS